MLIEHVPTVINEPLVVIFRFEVVRVALFKVSEVRDVSAFVTTITEPVTTKGVVQSTRGVQSKAVLPPLKLKAAVSLKLPITNAAAPDGAKFTTAPLKPPPLTAPVRTVPVAEMRVSVAEAVKSTPLAEKSILPELQNKTTTQRRTQEDLSPDSLKNSTLSG